MASDGMSGLGMCGIRQKFWFSEFKKNEWNQTDVKF